MKKFLLALGAFALLAGATAVPADAGNTVLFSSSKGDLTFPITPPTNAGATPGTLDNTDVGDSTPAAGHFTALSSSSGITGPVAATTLSASGAVSGAGFTARLATPGPIGNTVPSTGAFTTDSSAAFLGTGTAPVPTGTGTPTIAAGSTNTAGEVTAGSTATSVIITFNGAPLGNAPFCSVTTELQVAAFAYTISSSAITITQTATSGNKIDYVCFQH